MSDIVERLRRHIPRPIDGALGDLHEAADLIVSLRGELAKARNAALEEAAKWHDAQVQSYTGQISENDAYLARLGKTSAESRANEYCDDQRSTHRRSAAAIRALREEE